MKKTILGILIIFLLTILLTETNLYARELIDKTSEGYILRIPSKTLTGKVLPVLVCLPGWGVKAKDDINVWSFPAEKIGFVVIALDVDYSLIRSDSETRVLYHRIMHIVDSLSASYPLETKKLYIAGTSAGGMMSISLALMFPDKFTAVGVVSGGRLGFSAKTYLKNAKGCRFYMVHGEEDKSIPIGEFYSTKNILEKNGAIVKFDVISKGSHTLHSGVYREVIDWLSK